MVLKRETAKICTIKELINGRHVKREGWEPNYVETNIGKISRARITGIIIQKNENNTIIDDGTGMIELRSFDQEKKTDAEIGDCVLIIGRPRMYEEKKDVMPEIIKKIKNHKWIKYQLKKTAQQEKQTPNKNQIIKENNQLLDEKITEEKTNIVDLVLKKITELDSGAGTKIDDIIAFFKNERNINEIINKLIEEGEIFELKPGIIKTI